MEQLYDQIAERTGGEVYIGVVGPVRTGKSTFIKRFMDTVVIPHIDDVYMKERARDELPQSASGRTIMTAEPKFVPEEAVEISAGDGTMRVRLVDCVGYMVPGALGEFEDDTPRMVATPWFDHDIPMAEAAETGTKKVITEHSTIGLVITTDGTITEIPRADYREAEGRVINELKALGKPFLVIVNSADPGGEAAEAAKKEIDERYGVESEIVDCLNQDENGVLNLLSQVLYEFPLTELKVTLPEWACGLDNEHAIKQDVFAGLLDAARSVKKLRNLDIMVQAMKSCRYVDDARLGRVDLGIGSAELDIDMPRELYFEIIRQETGVDVGDDGELIPLLKELSAAKREYDRIKPALESVKATGYGIVMPSMEELELEEPELVKQGSRFGVRLRASAPSLHIMKANIETEVSPAVGSESQSEELLHYLLEEFDGDPGKIWQSNIFGKTLNELVSEGLTAKLGRMPDSAREKMRNTLERIINEGSGGLICIIL